MKLKTEKEYVEKAFSIKKCLNDFFKSAIGKDLKINDVNPYLVRHGIFFNDESNGLFLRQFLKELKKRGLLKLIPHISYIDKRNRVEWYFNPISISGSKKEFTPTIKEKSKYYLKITNTFKAKSFNNLSEEDLINTKKFIKNLPKGNKKEKLNSDYNRNYANWCYDEERLLIRFLDKTNDIPIISSLLERSTNSLKIKYQELKFINKKTV